MLKKVKYIVCVLSVALTSLSVGSCSDDLEDDGVALPYSAVLSAVELGNTKDSSKITYTGPVDAAWSAQITEGADFLSFSLSTKTSARSGTVMSSGSNSLFFYYDANSTGVDRMASITFTFEGQEPTVMALRQLSASSVNYPYSDGSTPRWFEIPAKVESDDYLYVMHKTTLSDSREVRNFSIGFDTKSYAAAWVAYPYHAIYEGDAGRNEKWAYDPLIPTAYQAKLTSSYGSYGGNSYDRGHQIASNDRQATDEMNEQTFYYSNMTPQLGTLNQQKWATLETTVRNQVCSDTLYVVTGADFRSVIGWSSDAEGKSCPIPNGYYKVLLRTKDGNTGKKISECTADELQAIGYWADHKHYTTTISPVSVKEIEDKTGFTFFPGVPAEVKATYNALNWW